MDTGSPFLLVDGSATASKERWGRFLNDEQSVPLDDVSGEMYGGQDVDVVAGQESLVIVPASTHLLIVFPNKARLY